MGRNWKPGDFASKHGNMLVRIDSVSEDGIITGGSYIENPPSGAVYHGGSWMGGAVSNEKYAPVSDPEHLLVIRVFRAAERAKEAQAILKAAEHEGHVCLAAIQALREAKVAGRPAAD